MNEMKLVSIPDADSPNFNALLALPGKKLRRIWAISAYYDHLSIKQLIEYMGDRGAGNANLELIIVLDRRAGVDKYLKKPDKKIKKKFGSGYSGIYLSPFGELFHSKGYLVESQKTGKCAVGSLNLTQKGLTENAEILALFDYKINSTSYASRFARSFKEYVWEILDHKNTHPASKEIEMPSRTRNYRRDIFLEGRLYYQANEVGPFGFKLDLPDDSLKDRSAISDYLEAITSDILDVRKLIDLKLEKIENEKKKSLWKSYCFQTCYGYWAPACHFENIESQIEKNKGCVGTYKNTFDALGEKSEELFSRLLEICRNLAPNIGNNWKFSSEDNRDLDEEMLRQKWEDWFCKLMSKNQEEFISRLCRNVQCVKMPDIWEDGEAVENFEDSFKQSFRYEANKNQSNNALFRLLREPGDDSPLKPIYEWLEQQSNS